MKIGKSKKDKGFSLLEIILAIAIFTMGVVGIGLFMVDILNTTDRVQSLDQGILLAREGIEAVKTIRDDDFSNIVGEPGDYGLQYVDDIGWSLDDDSTPDYIEIKLGREEGVGKTFTRIITIEDALNFINLETGTDSNIKYIKSTVSWPMRDNVSSVTLSTLLTDWQAIIEEEPEPEP